jgi:4-amino-4-deoxy-L-arabinose transferase-like glycosyltransferase
MSNPRTVVFPLWPRLLLLLAILLAFARLLYHLDANTIWWDESLSLVRAESDWVNLLNGRMVFNNGIMISISPDQHPFFYFALLKLFIPLAGISEFALRFIAALFSTALVPAVWVTAKRMERLGIALPPAALLAAFLAAFSPFFLWYGQEVRHYSLWFLLAALNLYCLLRWLTTTPQDQPRPLTMLAIYLLTILLLTLTHYYTALLLPVYLLVLLIRLAQHSLRQALWVIVFFVILAGIPMSLIGWRMINQPGVGSNNVRVGASTLAIDLVHSFGVGPTADLTQSWWFDGLFAGLALVGSIVALRLSANRRLLGWITTAAILVPPALLLVMTIFIAAYQTSRHMGAISSYFLLLVAIGVAWLWRRQTVLGVLLSILLLGRMAYSSYGYYTNPQTRSSDMRGIQHLLGERLAYGDLLLLYPVESLRIYEYYLPLEVVNQANAASSTENSSAKKAMPTSWVPIPPIDYQPANPQPTLDWLAALSQPYRRIWWVESGSFLTQDPNLLFRNWALSHWWLAGEYGFESETTSLKVYSFLLSPPVRPGSAVAAQAAADVVFGETDAQIRLIGYEVGAPLAPGMAMPVTLYWQTPQPLEQRYKYILQLAAGNAAGELGVLATTEREPYDSALPTTLWPTGETVIEYSEVATSSLSRRPGAQELEGAETLQLHLQLYCAETGEKLRIQEAGARQTLDDYTVVLPVSSD